MSAALAGVLGYIGLQLAVGLWVSRRVRTEDDYLVAGRRMGLGLVGWSVFATWFGAETCVSAAGKVYAEGITRTTVEPFAYGTCLLLSGLVFAAPLWRLRITTLADFLRARFSPATERLAALAMIPTSLFWAGAQIRAFGQILASLAPLELWLAIALAALVAISYTMLGGLIADIVTDLIQGVALVVGMLGLAFAITAELDGPQVVLERLARSAFRSDASHVSWLETLEIWALPLCGSVLAQEILSRALAGRSVDVARRGVLLGGAGYLAVGLFPISMGLLGPELVPDLADPEQVLPALASRYLPLLGFTVFIGALVSAILSTVDSTLLVAASLLSRNLLLAGRASVAQRGRVWSARLGVLAMGLIAWILALQGESVFDLLEDASGFGSAGILVATVSGLFTRFGAAASGLGAIAAGIFTWSLGYTGLPYPFLTSLGAALFAYVALSGVGTAARAAQSAPPRVAARR